MNKFIYSKRFQDIVSADPIVLVDAGARGHLDPPWSKLASGAIRVVGFEPDEAECHRLQADSKSNWEYIPKALWSSNGPVKVHIATTPGCSSVHPPNFDQIKRFEEHHWKSRITKETVTFDAVPLDEVLIAKGLACDFLKIDTQGAEYEILSGAVQALSKNIFGVLLETWTYEVHKGQKLTGELLTLMNMFGFGLFDVNLAAAWNRPTAASLGLRSKRQVIGLDLLFFKDLSGLEQAAPSVTKTVKAAAIADVYGFTDFAIELLRDQKTRHSGNKASLEEAERAIVECNRQYRSFKQRLRRKLASLRGVLIEEFPSLHY